MYKCSQCNKGVIVLNNETIKACKCDAPIIADMMVTMKGIGGTLT